MTPFLGLIHPVLRSNPFMNVSFQALCTFLLSLILALLLAGCPWNGKADNKTGILARNRALQLENKKLEAEITSKKAQTATLKMELLKKNAEINKLKVIQQGLGKEMARSKTKLFSPGNKAEAVTVLAEAETEIVTVKGHAQTGTSGLSFSGPEQLMSKSRSELDRGHYQKACSLATRALEQVQMIRLQAETNLSPSNSPIKHFVYPLTMRVIKMSNIRQYPSMKAKVVSTLNLGTEVKATDYHGHWIRILLKNRPLGWIYYSLLTLTKQKSGSRPLPAPSILPPVSSSRTLIPHH